MANEIIQTIFVIVAAIGLIAGGIALVAIYLALRPLIAEVQEIMPIVKQSSREAREIIASSREPVKEIWANVTQVSRAVRGQTINVDAFVTDTLDRARFQVIRIDQVTTNVLDKLQAAADRAEQAVMIPVREVTAMSKGLRRGLNTLFSVRSDDFR